MIGLIYCKHLGEIIGEVDELMEGGYKVTNPRRIHHTPQGIVSISVVELVDEDFITIDPDELVLKKVYKLKGDIEKEYKRHLDEPAPQQQKPQANKPKLHLLS